MGLEPETEYKITATCFSDIAESDPTEEITVTTTALPKITKINVPQRLDLYVDETKQLDVSTVPVEAMRAYEHVNKAVLDNSIVKFDGDNVTGVKSVNDNKENVDNIFPNDSSLWINGSFNDDGSLNSSNWKSKATSNFIAVSDKKMSIKTFKDVFGAFRIAQFDENKKFVSLTPKEWYLVLGKENASEHFELDERTKYIKISVTKYKDSEWKEFELKDIQNSEIYLGSTTNIPEKWSQSSLNTYSYTNANVTFNDAEKSSAEFDIYVHERKRMTSPTESDTASFIL